MPESSSSFWEPLHQPRCLSTMSRRVSLVCSRGADFPLVGPSLSRAEVFELAERAMHRLSAEVRLEMKCGLSGLATIASTGPLVGLFGTVIGIHDAFKGCGAGRWVCRRDHRRNFRSPPHHRPGLARCRTHSVVLQLSRQQNGRFRHRDENRVLELLNFFVLRLGPRKGSRLGLPPPL
jgi:hypothetical protein